MELEYTSPAYLEPGNKIWDEEGKFERTVVDVEFCTDGNAENNEEHYRVRVQPDETLIVYPDQEVGIIVED